jgi:arylsulfatase A-like enzyme
MYKGEDIEVDPISKPNIETFPPILQQYFEKQAVDSDGLAESIAKNYGMITMVDDQIGRVVKVLQDQDIYDNTIIVFLSDHGDYFGDHGLRRKALMPYDGVWRVPTIWRVPGAGAIDTQSLHSTVDIMPTLLELAGLECPTSVQGVSQAGVIHGDHPQAREVIYGELDEAKVVYGEGISAEMLEKQKQRVRYVRDGSTVLAYIYGADFGMMFDTEIDPAQLNNLFYSEDHRELRARMMEMLAHEGHRADHWHPQKVCHA